MNLAQTINEKAKQYQDYTANNLSELVKIKSLSAKEGTVVKKLREMMAEAGFDEIKIDGLGNIIGRLRSGKKIIAIDGHIDTVDVGNIQNWTFDPFGGEINNGFVHGRGSTDQKGGVASAITAARILKEIGLPKDVTLYVTGTVIEEDCDGLCWKYIIEEDKIIPDCVVVTEPTNLNIYRGHRGRMEIEVSFYGRSAHGSAPERGINAIYMASKAALEILAIVSPAFAGSSVSDKTTIIKSPFGEKTIPPSFSKKPISPVLWAIFVPADKYLGIRSFIVCLSKISIIFREYSLSIISPR